MLNRIKLINDALLLLGMIIMGKSMHNIYNFFTGKQENTYTLYYLLILLSAICINLFEWKWNILYNFSAPWSIQRNYVDNISFARTNIRIKIKDRMNELCTIIRNWKEIFKYLFIFFNFSFDSALLTDSRLVTIKCSKIAANLLHI